jgi:predicted nuclease of predicted toxin-antitoxin system
MDGMISFYSNENLDADLVVAIRDFGYDVLTSYEASQANQGITDEAVLRYATLSNRCVLTFDRGDFLALYRSKVHHCGIVVCKEMDVDYSAQVQVLHDYLRQDQTTLENRLLRLLRQNKPKSSQQFFVVREYSQ